MIRFKEFRKKFDSIKKKKPKSPEKKDGEGGYHQGLEVFNGIDGSSTNLGSESGRFITFDM